MDSAIEAFLTYLKTVRRASPNTIKAYSEDLRAFAEFAEAHGFSSPEAIPTEQL